jgi:hypothetical protein
MISVDSAGLAWLGARCERQANAIGDCAAPAVHGGLAATAAAVQALHSDVAVASRRIADRLQSTGEAALGAASAFAATEASNEDLIYEV